MGLPTFGYVAPETLQDVLSFLQEKGSETKIIAGGTDLLPSMKQGLFRPSYVLALQNVSGLSGMEFTKEAGLRLGPLTKLRELETSSVVAEHYPLLRQAANAVGSPQLRYMGTVGGNLALDTRCCYYNQSAAWRRSRETCLKMGGETCHAVGGGSRCFAVFSGDLAPALLALGASVTVASSRTTTTVPLREVYTGDGKGPLRLGADELLSGIHVPPPTPGAWSAYYKHRTRKAIDFPLASVAAVLVLDPGDKTCQHVRVALSGVATRPIEVEGLPALLEGRPLVSERVKEAASLAARQAKPVENLLGSSRTQRKWMIQAFVEKAIWQAVQSVA